ncbi:xylosyltransferase oxt-like [Ruditapes philippinarum]|uniref:xylosyltransferase oxt-like n=1 Tax=Ruditapes philippinarum TaxID=129788 RepID=UPI00295B7327|nr:xylosyltransferase oxt-like [Ruditapes philippinarum]
MPDSDQNTGQRCKQQCWSAGYKFAGTQGGVECFCGNIFINHGIGMGCTTMCSGSNNGEMCGGLWHLSLFETGLYVPNGFIGCYKDKRDRILSTSLYSSDSITGDVCKQDCKDAGYRYAGTEGLECFCGHTFKDYTKETGCNAWCSGNQNERCGGHWRISLYDTSCEFVNYLK